MVMGASGVSVPYGLSFYACYEAATDKTIMFTHVPDTLLNTHSIVQMNGTFTVQQNSAS